MIAADRILMGGTKQTVTEVAPAIQAPVRVLVVDDEPAACKLLSLILGPPAYQCTSASNGEEALVALQGGQFEAIISDLQMPGISGMELLAEARRCYPHLAFMVTTGVEDVDVGVQAMRCG